MRTVFAALLLLAAAYGQANCSSRWIVNAGSLWRSRDQLSLELQKKVFDTPCTYLVSGPRVPSAYAGWSVTWTRSAPSLAGLQKAAQDAQVAALLYDPEAWPMTPREEQTSPDVAACKAQVIAHQHGKILIVTPAIDLVRFLQPGARAGQRRFGRFESTGVAAKIARCADVYEIQAQGAEANTRMFRDFVKAEARQARQANPKIVILAGLSTNPMGRHVTAQQVLRAAQSVQGIVDGFWLNIPAGGRFCPSCGTPQPQVAADFLSAFTK